MPDDHRSVHAHQPPIAVMGKSQIRGGVADEDAARVEWTRQRIPRSSTRSAAITW